MIHVSPKDFQAVTCIPNSFIDEQMRRANGDFVKVYIYLLRSLPANDGAISISDIADTLDFTESDVLRALRYWEKEGVLCVDLGPDEPEDSKSEPPAKQTAQPEAIAPSEPAAQSSTTASMENKTYSADELTSFKNDPEAKELLFVTEKYLGRPLSVTDMNTILGWYDGLGLPFTLIEHLIEECVDAGHTSLHYMNRIAVDWAESGIKSVEDAKRTAQIHSQMYYGVIKAMGISGRDLVPAERSSIEKWTTQFGFTLDIITEACRRTVTNTGKPSFPYADSILTNWHTAGVKHLEDIQGLDTTPKASPKMAAAGSSRISDFPSRDYDYALLEQQLIRSQID